MAGHVPTKGPAVASQANKGAKGSCAAQLGLLDPMQGAQAPRQGAYAMKAGLPCQSGEDVRCRHSLLSLNFSAEGAYDYGFQLVALAPKKTSSLLVH